jgi:hypothetical protein
MKRLQKILKVRSSRRSHTLGKDTTLERASSLATKALVGKNFYLKMTKNQLKKWIQDYWKPMVGYCPRFSLLSNH